MRQHGRRLDQRGQALVEMALVLPVLLLLVVGMMEMARAWNAKQAITDAAREGARLAVVGDGGDQAEVEAAIDTALSRSGIPPGYADIQFDQTPAPDGNWRRAGEIQQVYVGLDYRFRFLGPLIEVTTGSPTIRIGTLVAMRNECCTAPPPAPAPAP
jgi:Flp pilus assembly protein TadG